MTIKNKILLHKHKKIVINNYSKIREYDSHMLHSLSEFHNASFLENEINFEITELENQVQLAIKRIDNLLDDVKHNDFTMLKSHAGFVEYEQNRVSIKWKVLYEKITEITHKYMLDAQ